MTGFKEFMAEIEAEAKKEGPEAVEELKALRKHFRQVRKMLQVIKKAVKEKINE
jgi:hypothetical protein